MMRFLALALVFLVTGCSSFGGRQYSGLQIGSATSKNLFIDSSQFANRNVKLRMRNSSGDPSLDLHRLRRSVEAGLQGAGYKISDENFGIVIDVNAYQMQAVYRSGVRSNSGLGALLGGVAGYEIARRPGGITSGSGAIIGVVAGAALEEVIRNYGDQATFLALCEVNIGVIKKEYTKKDRFVIGGNRIENKEPEEADSFTNFALRDSVRIGVFAGDEASKSGQTADAILDRLGRVVANLI